MKFSFNDLLKKKKHSCQRRNLSFLSQNTCLINPV
jgi:hypothetical protein